MRRSKPVPMLRRPNSDPAVGHRMARASRVHGGRTECGTQPSNLSTDIHLVRWLNRIGPMTGALRALSWTTCRFGCGIAASARRQAATLPDHG